MHSVVSNGTKHRGILTERDIFAQHLNKTLIEEYFILPNYKTIFYIFPFLYNIISTVEKKKRKLSELRNSPVHIASEWY